MKKLDNKQVDELKDKKVDVLLSLVKASDKDKFTVLASNGTLDRHGEVIDPKGWDTKNFKDSPVILFNHDHTRIVGKASNVRVDKDGLKMDIELASKGTSPDVDMVRNLVDEDILSKVSVGFIPKDWERNSDGNIVFTKTELLEVSLVGVPANPDAGKMKTYSHIKDVEEAQDTQDDVNDDTEDKEDELDDNTKQVLKMYRKGLLSLRKTLGIEPSEDENETIERVISYAKEALGGIRKSQTKTQSPFEALITTANPSKEKNDKDLVKLLAGSK